MLSAYKYVKYADSPDDGYCFEEDINSDFGMGIGTLIDFNNYGVINLRRYNLADGIP